MTFRYHFIVVLNNVCKFFLDLFQRKIQLFQFTIHSINKIKLFFLFQEIQQLRQHIVQAEQQLRAILSPTYLPNDREKALEEQQVC